MDVVCGPDRRELGTKLAQALDSTLHVFDRTQFPDGERYVRLDPSLSEEVALVADIRTNDLLVEALIALDAAAEAGAERVHLCVPYLSYARQDRAFQPGEGVSSRAVNRALSTGAASLVTVDVHAPAVLDFFDGASANQSPAPEMAEVLGEAGADLVLAPDAGARARASEVAASLGVPVDHLEKTRLSSTEVRMTPKELDAEGATVAIVDDIISTGGTMATATGQLLEAGAERVLVAATHGIFAPGAVDRLEKAGVDQVLVTDTVPSDQSRISCTGALLRGLRAVQGA